MPSIALPVSLRGQLLSGSRFNPVSLFSAGEQGIWLEPSDLTTMFQDRAGTTPVTTPGQTVGLRLDKSKGLVLGSELVTNGTFDTDTTGWSSGNGAVLSNDAGRLKVALVASGGWAAQSISTVIGASYRVDFTVTNGDATGVYLFIGTANNNTAENYDSGAKANGTYTAIFRATATTTFIKPFVLGSAGKFAFYDNISVKELPGNHAVAPTDAARPTYGIEPKTGRRNLLIQSEEFDNAPWLKNTTTVSANAIAAPNGTMTADLAQNNGQIFLVISASSANYTLSIYAKTVSGNNLVFGYYTGAFRRATYNLSTGLVTNIPASHTATAVAVGDGWYRCTLTFTSAVTEVNFTPSGASGIYIWGAQLEASATATAYQRVGTAFDVTEAGVPTVHYVQYDGTDDSFSTSSIDFSATDKMSVFAGVRKLSDATRGIVAELSAAATSGAWNLNAPNATTTANYAFRNVGSLSGGDAVTSSTFAAPTSNVLTALGDIAADVSQLRVNGSVAATSAVDLGTGNYGNYPLYIGRRNNASLPFNGRDYGIIVVGKTASATGITNTESYLAANTSGVTI